MEIIGKVIQVLPLIENVSKAGKPWQLKTFIIETQDSFPKQVAIELFGEDRVKDNPVEVDDVVTAHVDVESREYNGRWFTSVRAWKVDKGIAPATQAAPKAAQATMPAAPVPPAAPQFVSTQSDNLPF